jgi:hypothetical protein
VDVKGAFLHREFDAGKVIYMKMPCGFEKFYPDDVVLKLKKCIYGLINLSGKGCDHIQLSTIAL